MCLFAVVALLHESVLPAWAESRTPPEATQHALDELANCRAQNRPGAGQICPTETATPSPTPRPTSTPQPAASATPVPVDVSPVATPLPVMPVSGNGYTRPLDDYWLELALQQGRWAVYQADDCTPRVDPWVNVRTQVQDTGEVDLISEVADCGLVVEQWLSDAPCSVNDQGACDVSADASFWDMLSHLPTPTPTPTPTSAPPVAPTRAATQSQARQPAAAVPQVQLRTVVQTVVVVVPAEPEPTDTPVSIATPSPSPTRPPTVGPTRSPTATSTSTGEPTALPAAAVSATPAQTDSHISSTSAGRWDWLGLLKTVAVVVLIGGVAVWLLTRRKVVRWGARPIPAEEPHAD
ncbi:MAG: hypothetical protein JO352_03665 [Chloroflexi bacterium]|nr:hypothetical protein [Chloroflexota bacterium]